LTAIVGIRCKDGVVIGADSSATFGDGSTLRTIEQPTEHKIEIIDNTIIVAGTGYVGHMQRFDAVVRGLWTSKALVAKSDIEVGKAISSAALKDFDSTHTTQNIQFSALVAYPSKDQAVLCELPGLRMMFQPEIKKVNDLWWTSVGSGQPITDPFLALLRQVFWSDGAPTVQGGIFTALWALKHACDVNPGGIKEPIKIAIMKREAGRLGSKMLSEDELAEHHSSVREATKHMATFRNILEGTAAPAMIPPPMPTAAP
jgi:ATP-dependent protease HslVU (ClpYQ) peptidase subunit